MTQITEKTEWYKLSNIFLSSIKIRERDLIKCLDMLMAKHTKIELYKEEYHNFINHFLKVINNKQMTGTELLLVIITLRQKYPLLLNEDFIMVHIHSIKSVSYIDSINDTLSKSSNEQIINLFSTVLKENHSVVDEIFRKEKKQIDTLTFVPKKATEYPDDSVLTINGLKQKYLDCVYDYNHPVFTKMHWRIAVSGLWTESGYWEWVFESIVKMNQENS